MYISAKISQVTVETLERGFLINVFSERNCPGMLAAILDAFEELGLDVLDARVSCEDTFQLEAVGGEVRKLILFFLFYLSIYLFFFNSLNHINDDL